jgi:hypothetical protein
MTDLSVMIDGERYVPAEPRANRVSIWGMYDMHLFHRIEGSTVDEIIKNWLEHNSKKQPATVGDRYVEDMGQSSLCPAIVLHGDRELRRVGRMVFADYNQRGKPRDKSELAAYRKALLDDPDITRLLNTGSKP